MAEMPSHMRNDYSRLARIAVVSKRQRNSLELKKNDSQIKPSLVLK